MPNICSKKQENLSTILPRHIFADRMFSLTVDPGVLPLFDSFERRRSPPSKPQVHWQSPMAPHTGFHLLFNAVVCIAFAALHWSPLSLVLASTSYESFD